MPPRRGESLDRSDEYEEFLKKLSEYHEKRGTTLDPEPKVGVRHIDLLKLYHRIVDEGGYDLVSDTKAKPLMWRKFAEEFIGKNVYTPAQAFQIKNVYYKNLCAYEISTHWEKEPPPKEILEEVTAKGGSVMSRTLENFERPLKKEERDLGGEGEGSDASPEQKTPSQDKMDEDPGSATGRSTRGLRHQPPQRVLFQPDVKAGRQARGIGLPQQDSFSSSPAPPGAGPNGIMGAQMPINTAASATLASYEPPQSYPLSLKPVTTPANNPDFYRTALKRKIADQAGPLAKKYKSIMLPGTGFIGPNIYVRAQLALQSGLEAEEGYALHHLVKISNERGDKYRFDQFPGLAEGLVKKALQVSNLYYDVDWDVSYDDEDIGPEEEVLDGLQGTSNIIEKLRSKIPLVTNDTLHDSAFLSQLNKITEAGLVVRNMVMLDENARFISAIPLVRDYLAVVLDLPPYSNIVELQTYALETAEQVLRYCDISPHDALYHSLLSQVDRADRRAIILALRTISRIAEKLPPPKRLDGISERQLRMVRDWLMVEDEELRSACLDFLVQYSSFADNVENLLQALDGEKLAKQLTRLLWLGAREHKDARPSAHKDASKDDAPEGPQQVARLSRSIISSLLIHPEPERSAEWLKTCFVADPGSELTQISLWQAYQQAFGALSGGGAGGGLLIAGDFIKNVSNTFAGATAQVAGGNKYVIRGIKARKVPVEKGRELRRCCWSDCGEWFRSGEEIFRHVLGQHLQLPTKERERESGVKDEDEVGEDKMEIDRPESAASMNGTPNGVTTLKDSFNWSLADKTMYRCRWSDCHRSSADFDDANAPRTALLARHIQTHLPSSTSTDQSRHNVKPESKATENTKVESTYFTTLQDEKGDAASVPLGAALVLRNIAKFIPASTAVASSGAQSVLTNEKPLEVRESEALVGKVFDAEVRERLFEAVASQRTVREYVGSVLRGVGVKG